MSYVVVMYHPGVVWPVEVHGPFDTEADAEEWAWPNGHRHSWTVVPLLRVFDCEFCLGETDHVPACPVSMKLTSRRRGGS